MNITSNNNGSLKELMASELVNIKASHNYLTSKIGGSDGLQMITANNRGFVIGLDYSRNPTVGAMNPDGGNLTRTNSPNLDRMTCNLQYLQFGQEVSNLQMANSKSSVHVGASAKALAARKLLERRAEIEEWYFCRGDGTQQLADITGAVTAVLNTEVSVPTSGSRDGAGSYLLGVGQPVRIYTSAMVFKSLGIITSKSSNGSFGYTATSITTAGIVDTDKVLPEGDAVAPTTTGVKGLPYLVKANGPYFDKTLSGTPALQAVVDSTTTTFTRTTMEMLRANSELRAGNDNKQRAVCSKAQRSNYFAQFYAQNSSQVHVVGGERPNVDLGAKSPDYTFWGQPIDVFDFIHPKFWLNLDYSAFKRLTLKEAGAMLTPAGDFVQKISGGVYANAQQQWDDDYLEFLSDTPHKNSCFNSLTFTGLPLLVNSPYTGV